MLNPWIPGVLPHGPLKTKCSPCMEDSSPPTSNPHPDLTLHWSSKQCIPPSLDHHNIAGTMCPPLFRQCRVYARAEGMTADQVELVIQQLLVVSAAVQLGRQAVVRVEASPRHIQPNLAHCTCTHTSSLHRTRNAFLCLESNRQE